MMSSRPRLHAEPIYLLSWEYSPTNSSSISFVCPSYLCPPQSECIRNHRNRAEAHGRRCNHRAQENPEEGVQDSCRYGHTDRVIDKGEEEVLLASSPNLGMNAWNFPFILNEFLAELALHIPFFSHRQPVVGKDEYRPHDQCCQRRPLNEEPDGYEKQAVILRMPHMGVHSFRDQPLPLGLVDEHPSLVHDVKTVKYDEIAYEMENDHGCT